MATIPNQEDVTIRDPKPFLRWAGGKNWLLKELHNFLPSKGYNNYHELFVGGGSVFFHLQPRKLAFLNDLNLELIETYQTLQVEVEEVIKELRSFENTEEFYYEIREAKLRSDSKKAARFIYLNQTSFNGIYRVNLKGEYNVPYGYRTKQFLEPENLRLVSKALANVVFSSDEFYNCIDNVKKNDLVFLDPPYTITHNHNGFFKYNKKLFSEEDQHELAKTIDKIKTKGAYYILTNAAHQKVREIFEKGDRCIELKRASLIGGINAKRGKYSEFLFTNTK